MRHENLDAFALQQRSLIDIMRNKERSMVSDQVRRRTMRVMAGYMVIARILRQAQDA